MKAHLWKFRFYLLLVFAFLGLFLVYPIIHVIQGSVLVEYPDGKTRFTLIFFQMFAESPVMLECLWNSFAMAGCTTVLSICVALPLAWLFVKYQFPCKPLWNTLLLAPFILPPFVGAIGLQQILARFGTLNHLLGLVGPDVANPMPIDWLGSGGFTGVVLMQVMHLYPILFLSLSHALVNINPSAAESARCLGASPSHVFRTITLPLLTPALFAGGTIVFIWAFTDLGTPLIFGFYKVVAVQIFDKSKEMGFNPFAYSLVIIVLLVTVILFLASRRFVNKRDYVTQGKADTRADAKTLTGLNTIWVVLGLLFLSIITLAPHLSVVLQSVSQKWFMTALPAEWTAGHYAEVFQTQHAAQSLKNSLYFSIASAMIDVVLGVSIAYWLARREFKGKTLLDALTILPLALPGVVLAFGYLAAFNVPTKWGDWDLTWLRSFVNPRENPTLLLIISYSVRRLPFIVRTTYAGLQQTSVSLEEASLNLGANRSTTFRRIVLPLLRANIVAGAILCFAFAFLEVSDSLILAMKERFYPVTKEIYHLLGRIEPGAAGIACALGVIGMIVLFLSFFVSNRLLGKKTGSIFQ